MPASIRPGGRVLLALAGLVVAAVVLVVAPVRGGARPVAGSAGCAAPQSAGDRTVRLEVGGLIRSAVVHVPPRALGHPAPLVLAFHGTGGSGPFMSSYSGLSRVADRAGFVAVFPSADEEQERWTLEETPRAGAPDDVAFARALLAEVARQQCVDRARVSAVGVSNGGGFAARLGCEMSYQLAAIAVVAGGFGERPRCPGKASVSVLEIHGTADPVVPYEGREDGEGSVAGWLAGWTRRDRCVVPPRQRSIASRVVRTDWTGCRDGAEVSHLRIAGGVHQWPGATPPDPGPASTISAAEEIWRFLAPRRLSDVK